MSTLRLSALVGASLIALAATPAMAQTAPAAGGVPASTATEGAPDTNAPQTKQQDSTTLGQEDGINVSDVVVTARRQTENIQNVPQAVTAISGESIKKLNFTQFQDIAAAVPGLTLNTGAVTGGRSPSPSIRGVTYDASTTPSPTVDIYVNDAPVGANIAFNAIYDIGDIEVLRGPQGTLRGRSAPSGAILISTKRASTTDWGGYLSGLGTDKHSINGQGALNIPVIQGVLGVRVSGDVDQNDFDFVRSTGTGLKPFRNTESGRVSVAFTPASNLSVNVVYQYLHQSSRQFTQVEGPGATGGVVATAPANYNGPAITASQRLGADDFGRDVDDRTHQVTANVAWNILGHTLEYTGGYVNDASTTLGAVDYGNQIIGQPYFQNLFSSSRSWTHEVRLSSTGAGHLLDYSVGYFHSNTNGLTTGAGPAATLAGTFGLPTPSPTVYNTQYVLPALISAGGPTIENSFYANATLHLGSRTDITGGARYIINQTNGFSLVYLGAGNIAVRIPVNCALLGYTASPYAGYCNVPLAAGTTPVFNGSRNVTSRPVVYNVTVRHRFSDELLAYAAVGSSWRRGGGNFGITNAAGDPTLNSLAFTPDETSTSYEVGVKTNFLDRRLRLNLTGFYQKYNNLVFQVTSVPYVTTNGQASSTALVNSNINVGANAIVKGFDFDGAFQVNRNFSVSAAVSYADGKVDNAVIPCRDANFDGVPDSGTPTLADYQSRGLYIAQCRSNQSVSRDPLWNASFQSEYHAPISDGIEVYLRGLGNFYPSNSRQSAGLTVSKYTLINLYGGIRSPDGAWDVGVFVRNVTDAGVLLSRDPSILTSGTLNTTFGSPGYRFATYTPPRQVGLSVRYSFGGR